MKKKTKDKLDTEIDNYIDRTINILSGNAGLAFVAGEIKASNTMGISYDKPSPDSLVYARAYRQLLVDEGATIINGEKVYWMADREKELREQLFNKIEEGFKEGRKTYGSGSIADDIAEILGVEHWKAQRISRTEVKRIMNAGTIQRYERNKVKYVQVLDNEGENSCEECAKINGQKWDIEYANSHELEHPNCVRSFVPIFDDELPEGFVPDNQIEEEELIEYDWLTEAKDREDLTPEMEKGLQDYSATSFPINSELRHGDDENFTRRSSSEQYLRDIGAIKDIFNLETSAMQEDTVLWRGVDRQAIALMKRASKDPYGETLLDKGFLSTSLDKDIALMFGADMDKREVILIKILCPKGTRGINIGQSYTYDQKEVLLQNSSVLHIVSEDTRGVTNEEIKRLYELGATMEDAENTKVKIYTVEFKGSLDDYYED